MSVITQFGWVFPIILVAGVGAVWVFLERMLALRRAQIDYMDFIKGVCNVLDIGNAEEAIMLCEETPGPVAAVAMAAIQHRKATRDALREAVDNTGRAEISRLERRLASIAVTCQIAPLLGLLGTLHGVMNIVLGFNASAPLVQTTDMTAGLLQALVSAVAGLLVAIPCHVMYMMLIVRIERIVLEMEAGASEIVAYLTREDTSML
ncbi:MAG: MotA/TolQ/ExbB proton channel family protein [Kiritimatiellaeota bacterium]|nr:MotA/TolQ/ExbB proton channel family protein [Kiritimatiellota bacterium]